MQRKQIVLSILSTLVVGFSTFPSFANQVATGNHHAFIEVNGTVLSFGENSECSPSASSPQVLREANLGRPSDSDSIPATYADCGMAQYNPTPGAVTGLPNEPIKQLGSGQNDGFVITDSGRLFMWGRNDYGQGGAGNMDIQTTAVEVVLDGGSPVISAAIGGANSIAVTQSGKVYTWGSNTLDGAILANGYNDDSITREVLTPTAVPLPAGAGNPIKVLAEANRNVMVLTDSGKVFMSGRNNQGQAGQGSKATSYYYNFIEVVGISGIPMVDIGFASQVFFAIDGNGDIYGWGDGNAGLLGIALGDGSPDKMDILQPTNLTSVNSAIPGKVVQIAGGSRHVLALNEFGDVYVWGYNTALNGNLGIGGMDWPQQRIDYVGDFYTPFKLDAFDGQKVESINLLTNNSMVVTQSGDIYGWGQTSNGRLAMGIKSCDRDLTFSSSDQYQAGYVYPCNRPYLINTSTNRADIEQANLADIVTVNYDYDLTNIVEGDSITITATIDKPVMQDVELTFAVNYNDSKAADFVTSNFTLTVPKPEFVWTDTDADGRLDNAEQSSISTNTVSLDVSDLFATVDDALVESAESFTIRLVNATTTDGVSQFDLQQNTSIITINDNDSVTAEPLTSNPSIDVETATQVITAELSGDSSSTCVVDLLTEAVSLPPLPNGAEFVGGKGIQFDASNCATGESVTLTIDYQTIEPAAGYAYYKYTTAKGWFSYPYTRVGNSVSISVTDGSSADNDDLLDGNISDPGGLVKLSAGGAGSTSTIPSLSILSMLLALISFVGFAAYRLRGR